MPAGVQATLASLFDEVDVEASPAAVRATAASTRHLRGAHPTTMASIALGASVAARVTPARLKPGRRGALTRRGDVSSARKSIRCDAADDEVRPAAQKRAPEASRRGFLGTAAAFAAGALP